MCQLAAVNSLKTMRKYEQSCPIARTLDVIGDRWTLLIVRDLMTGSTKFRELRASGGIPPKVLSARLKMMLDAGVVERQVYSEHPLRAEYRLTDKGRDLVPVLLEIGKWGLVYMYEGDPELRDRVAGAIYDSIPETRDGLVEAGYVKRRTRTD
jgi:DNA-binding HxlR family transcriptional regulator